MPKTCRTCGKTAPLSAFARRGDRHENLCLECRRAYQRARYIEKDQTHKIIGAVKNNKRRRAELRAMVDQIKRGCPCADCGISYAPWVMQFDHVRGRKSFGISDAALRNFSTARILAEIEKCEIVCANCHAERTHSSRAKKSAGAA